MTQPGAASQPEDTTGDGSVTLSDRTEPGGQGSPDTNQAKAEPVPTNEHETDPGAPREAPSLGSMNVGVNDPQAPSHPAAGHQPEHVPDRTHPFEQPGRYPADDPAEHQVVDLAAGARAMNEESTSPTTTPGDAQGVVVSSTQALFGSSEEQGGVDGVRP